MNELIYSVACLASHSLPRRVSGDEAGWFSGWKCGLGESACVVVLCRYELGSGSSTP